MENRTPLYSPEDIRGLERKNRNTKLFCLALGIAVLGCCIALCCLTTPFNAARMERSCTALWVAAGWLILYLRRFVIADSRHELQHAQMLDAGLEQAEALHGRLRLTQERLRIKNSIGITMAELETAEGRRRLKFCSSRAKKLKDAGEELTLYLVNGYIAGYGL